MSYMYDFVGLDLRYRKSHSLSYDVVGPTNDIVGRQESRCIGIFLMGLDIG